jgi:hypothetical protein
MYYSSLPIYQYFSSRLTYTFTLKMEAEGSSETLVTLYQTTRHHIPEDSDLDKSLLRDTSNIIC